MQKKAKNRKCKHKLRLTETVHSVWVTSKNVWASFFLSVDCFAFSRNRFSFILMWSPIFNVAFFPYFAIFSHSSLLFWESISFHFVCLMNDTEQTREEGMKETNIEWTKIEWVCMCSHCVQKNEKTATTTTTKCTFGSIWHRIYTYFGWNIRLLQWLSTYTQSLENKNTRCNKQQSSSILFALFFSSLLVASSLRCFSLLLLPSLLVLFYNIFSSSHESRSGGSAYERIYVHNFFLVRFINDVTFNICETWAQNQFLMRIIPCGLLASLSLSIPANIYCSLAHFR